MSEHDDAAEAVEELRRELDRVADALPDDAQPADATGSDDEALRARVRAVAERRGVTGDHPALISPGRLAPAKRTAKETIRKASRWYVERLALDVRAFADAVSAAVDAIAERIIVVERRQGEMEAFRADAERQLAAYRDRLARLERRRRTASAPAAAPAAESTGSPGVAPAAAAAPLDYFAFESTMRGSREEITERQRDFVPRFEDVDDILDVGCGRGEFLQLLKEAGKTARGVDADAEMAEWCREQGLDVEHGDGIAVLSAAEADSLGGVFAAQVVEHLPPGPLVAFLNAAQNALRPGGVIVLETINPASLSALRNYFADLTHAQPLVPQTLAFLVETSGFQEVEVELRSPLPEEQRLRHLPHAEGAPAELAEASTHNVDRLNDLLFAPQDYAVIARA